MLLKDEGWTWIQISHAPLLSEEALRLHIKDYQASRKLKPNNGDSEEKLCSVVSEQLTTHLENYAYQCTKDIGLRNNREKILC